MNTAELHNSLNDEQKLALLALRDELNTAASAHDAELGAAHLAEKEALKKRISELVAKAETDAIAAKEAADKALAQAKDDAANDLAAANTRAKTLLAGKDSEIAELKKTAALNSESAKDAIATLTAAVNAATQERDAQVARMNELARAALDRENEEDALDARWLEVRGKRKAIVATLALSLDEQEAAAKEAKRKTLEAELAKLA